MERLSKLEYQVDEDLCTIYDCIDKVIEFIEEIRPTKAPVKDDQ